MQIMMGLLSSYAPGKEIIFTSGANNTGADYIHVYTIVDFTEKWLSKAVEEPFTDVEVADVDDDGRTHTIEHDQTYYPDPKPIHDIEFMDINGDGQKEFVAAAQSYVYIINPADFSLTWTSPAIPWNYDYVTVKFLTGNIDLDPNIEIVVLNKNISVIDPITNEIWSSEGYNYRSFCLYDYNDDGLDDIIAGDEDGKIEVGDTCD